MKAAIYVAVIGFVTYFASNGTAGHMMHLGV